MIGPPDSIFTWSVIAEESKYIAPSDIKSILWVKEVEENSKEEDESQHEEEIPLEEPKNQK